MTMLHFCEHTLSRPPTPYSQCCTSRSAHVFCLSPPPLAASCTSWQSTMQPSRSGCSS